MAKVLLGFDGSAESRRAARKAAELAASRGSTLVVAQVVPPLIIPGDIPTIPVPQFTEQQLQEAERLGAELLKELAGSGARMESAVLVGFPAPELLRISESDPDVELVVVGRAGKGAIARVLMGSVSSRLAHACVKPVLIVP
ncbi:MAG TPA: universal stress protein [Myxococcaceae bacterium]|nr:universal stress protein [Myxococcaceae bacterium]